MITDALYQLYPQVTHTIDDVAYDKDNNIVQYDANAVLAKEIELQSAESAQQQAQATAKASALAKLTALGLSEDEVKALLG